MHPNPRLSRGDAERLLAGDPVVAPQLAALLAAASAEGSAGELAGENAALLAFHQSRLVPVATTRRRTLIPKAIATAVTAKLATTGAIALAATGGIALAAATGVLPTPNLGHSNQTPAATHSATHPAPKATESETPDASPSPSPNLRGLCTAYRAGATDNKGKAADNPAFSFLTSAAGGADNIAGYCDTLLGANTHKPKNPGAASSHANAPTSHPTGRPTAVPSASHPTGKPNPVPSASHPTR